MKIAYLSQTYPPMINGVSVAVRSQAEAMAARGHQVLVITSSDRPKPYMSQRGSPTLLRLQSFHNPARVGQRALLYPRRSILRVLDDFQPDLIHTHEALQMGWIGVQYARRARIPIILTIPQLPWFASSYLPDISSIRKMTESMLWGYARWILQKMDAVIAPTQTISAILTENANIQPYTISYGINLATFHPRPSPDAERILRHKLGLPADIPVILHVGRLDTDKRVDRVVRASAEVMPATGAHLLLVGDGRERPALERLARSLGIARRVHFPGFITVEQGLPDVYRLASLFVTASEIETQGIVLLEAAASGMPIAAVRATCIPEIVHHGENGFLSASGDIHGLAHSMNALLQQPTLAKQMGQTGRQLSQAHDAQATLDRHEQLYREISALRIGSVPGMEALPAMSDRPAPAKLITPRSSKVYEGK